jgi:hypothetical protein
MLEDRSRVPEVTPQMLVDSLEDRPEAFLLVTRVVPGDP